MEKKIGLFLSAEPYSGGVFQYSLSIIKALEALDVKKYNTQCFVLDDRWVEHLPSYFEVVEVKRRFHNRALSYVVRWLLRTPFGWKFSGRFNDVVKVINKSDCDVVIYPAQDLQAYQTNKPSIVAIHDLMHRYETRFDEYKGSECAIRDIHYSAICKYSDAILVDSEIGKTHVLDCYQVDEEKVHILPFVPPYYLLKSEVVDIRSKYGLPEKFIFYPAQFWEHKNHKALLRAIRVLKDNGENINLILVGSQQNNYDYIVQLIEELELGEQVFILGYVSNDEMLSLYKTAVAMIFVSLIGPTNIPPMEALVTGCPLVCSNAYGMPDQVGKAALLIDPREPTDIGKKISIVWNDEKVRRKLIRHGYEQVESYGQKDFSDRLIYAIQCMRIVEEE